LEKGVDTGGVAAANCEGVRPCCDGACFMGVGVDMSAGAVVELWGSEPMELEGSREVG